MPSNRGGQTKPRGHFGNNGLRGKPSNNKGKKRKKKVPRRSKLDMELSASNDGKAELPQEVDSDVEELLDHEPISAHMYRSAFVKTWCSKLRTTEVNEEAPMRDVLGHNPSIETNCIFAPKFQRSCGNIIFVRERIAVCQYHHFPNSCVFYILTLLLHHNDQTTD